MKKNQTKSDKKTKFVDPGLCQKRLLKLDELIARTKKAVAKRNLKPEIIQEAIKWARQQKKINTNEQEKIQKEESERAEKEYWEKLPAEDKLIKTVQRDNVKEDEVTKIFNQLDTISDLNKKIELAKAIKEYFIKIKKWEKKECSKKQIEKLQKIKQILGDTIC